MYVYEYMCQHIYIYMYIHMARVKLASGARLVESNFRKFECSCWCSSILFEKTKWKCVPQMGRIYVTQNDNKNDNKINPKAIFKHHGPLITLPWRFSPDEPITIRLPALIIEQIIDWIFLCSFHWTNKPEFIIDVATCGYGEFAPRSVFAAKVWMPEVNGSWTNDFLDGGRMCINLFDCDKCR